MAKSEALAEGKDAEKLSEHLARAMEAGPFTWIIHCADWGCHTRIAQHCKPQAEQQKGAECGETAGSCHLERSASKHSLA